MADLAQPAIAGEYPPLHGGKLFFLTVAIATASFMEILDMTIVNVSVPSISGSLGVTPSEGTWAVSSYMLAAAIMQPLSGWIARRFGEVRTFVTSILLFMVFSAVCGVANSLPMLVGARLVQGLCVRSHDVGRTGDIAAQLSHREARYGAWALVDGHHDCADIRPHHRRLDHG